jgi:hypothetical protein
MIHSVVLRPAVVLLIIGFTVGPVLDGLHTFSGTTWYPDPQWMRSVWWCPPLFAAAALAIGMGRVYSERFFKRPGPSLSWTQVLSAMALFIGCYAASGFLPVSELFRALLLTVCFGLGWALWDRTALGLASALSCGFCGWAVEHTLVHNGFFFHRETTLDGIALWIPPLYFLAALAVGSLARRLHLQASTAP